MKKGEEQEGKRWGKEVTPRMKKEGEMKMGKRRKKERGEKMKGRRC